MREKIVPAVFLILVLLIGFPSSVANFSVFADDDDDNDNLYVSSEKFENAIEDAEDAIEDAKEEIDEARKKIERESNKGKETTLAQEQLDEAIAKLEMAEQSFALGNFEETEELAEEAEDLASEARGKLIGKTESDIEDEHEVEIKAEIHERDLELMFFTLVGSISQIFVNDETEFENFEEFSDLIPGFLVEVEVVLSNGSHVATQIEIDDNGYEKDDKVTLCHIPKGNHINAHTITVGAPAYGAHLAHGDYEGPCDYDPESSLAKIEAKLAKKYEKLQEKRYEFEQKQIELAEKYAKKLAKLESKYADKEAKLTEKYNLKLERLSEELAERQDKYLKKSEELQQKLNEKIDKLDLRTQKLVENFNSGEYFGEVDEEEDETRKYVLKFDSLTGESFVEPSTSVEFFAEITLESSSSGSDDNLKFKVTGCSIIGEGDSYSCAFGKARTVSSGTSGDEEKLTIIAFLEDDDSESTSSLKVFVTPVDSSFASLEDSAIDVTMKGSITLQWSLSGDGTLSVIDNSEDNP